MSTKARIAHLFSPLTRWWLPEATPARLLLFFIVTAVFVLASILWGLFVKYPSMHNVGVALCIVALYSIVFATTFAMAKPDMDRKLQKHRRKLLTVSKIIAVMLAVGSIGTAIVMIPWLYTNGNVSVFGRIQIPPATSDDIVITRQANQLLLDGKDPYGHTNIIKAMKDYKTVAPTPLQQGDFEDIYPTPSEEQIDDEIIEAKANPDVVPPEFESTLSYPAGAFLFRIPFDASGIAPQWF